MSSIIVVNPADIRAAAIDLSIPVGQQVDTAISSLIGKAIVRIEHAFPDIATRIERGELDYELVKGVVEDMVLRVLRNPNAKRSESLDDYSYMIDTALSSGQLYLSDYEASLLAPPRRGARGVRSISLRIPRWRVPGA